MTTIPNTKAPLKMLRLKQVLEYTGLSRSTVYDLLDSKSPRHDPSFPKQIKITECSVAWIESEINDWIESRISKSRA